MCFTKELWNANPDVITYEGRQLKTAAPVELARTIHRVRNLAGAFHRLPSTEMIRNMLWIRMNYACGARWQIKTEVELPTFSAGTGRVT
jgi:hypothetical protein